LIHAVKDLVGGYRDRAFLPREQQLFRFERQARCLLRGPNTDGLFVIIHFLTQVRKYEKIPISLVSDETFHENINIAGNRTISS
jgi:hypothetical protein